MHQNRRLGGRHQPASLFLGAVLIGAALIGLSASPAAAAIGDYACADASRVYLGNARLFHNPCHVNSSAIYRQIAEYREILERSLSDHDPQYHLLMQKAAKRFNDALKTMARNQGHDLVAETGTITKARNEASDVPERTQAAIAALTP